MPFDNTNLLQIPTRVTVEQGHYALKVGQSTVDIDVTHSESNHILKISGEHNFELVVQPPAPRYASVNDEPSDNSLAARSRRFPQARLDGEHTSENIWLASYAVFSFWTEQEYFSLADAGANAELLLSGLAQVSPADPSAALVSRAAFWQGAGGDVSCWAPIVSRIPLRDFAYVPTTTIATRKGPRQGPRHPVRVPKVGAWDAQNLEASSAPLYSRYIPQLGQTLSYRFASSKRKSDVDLLHRWHATDRVNTGWRQDMSWDDHKAYLEDIEASSDQIALIGEWDGEPWGYVEVYWAKESVLHNFYPAGDYDRGYHILVGEERFRGPHRVRSWMGSLVHLIFLLDPRTQLVVGEPRATNAKAVDYFCLMGGHVHSHIDLGHKRAAMIHISRERFFQLAPLHPQQNE
ncbi:hypothetical protein MCUN1_000394 [Malassezia cuniculi]|uniref:Acyltransferase MbtK/IucB-like conserved domain-containing protein n=1 Tax=Malassezia cuniculi TaxID=948313 RepID=A0AAF0ES95_9BASI|nr:hypothetical protein MCUN1_000394 [Malassezia cuniculi]